MATVSGPGSQPVREVSDAAYGEQKTFRELQQGAPMAQAAGVPAGQPAADPAANVVPLTEGSQRPGEPVTTGNPLGPGPGPTPPDAGGEARALLPFLPMLERRANVPESSQTLRNIVQYLKGLG